jgi:hypothetical protein
VSCFYFPRILQNRRWISSSDTSKFRSLEHVGGLISAAPKERSWRVAGDWEWRRGLTGRKGGTVGDLRGGRWGWARVGRGGCSDPCKALGDGSDSPWNLRRRETGEGQRSRMRWKARRSPEGNSDDWALNCLRPGLYRRTMVDDLAPAQERNRWGAGAVRKMD